MAKDIIENNHTQYRWTLVFVSNTIKFRYKFESAELIKVGMLQTANEKKLDLDVGLYKTDVRAANKKVKDKIIKIKAENILQHQKNKSMATVKKILTIKLITK